MGEGRKSEAEGGKRFGFEPAAGLVGLVRLARWERRIGPW